MNKLAQLDFGTFEGFGPLGKPGGTGIDIFTTMISTAVGVMTIVAFVWFVFQFFIGAMGIISAGGDKQMLENARKKIINGIVGIIVVISAVFIISLIGTILNVPFLSLPELFSRVTGGNKP